MKHFSVANMIMQGQLLEYKSFCFFVLLLDVKYENISNFTHRSFKGISLLFFPQNIFLKIICECYIDTLYLLEAHRK